MKDMNAIFAGFGGQGVLFLGKAVAYAAMFQNKEVTWLPSYGPEMRGGAANSSVCVSDKPIFSPLVNQPNALIVMNLPSFDKYIPMMAPGGVVVIDSALVSKKVARDNIEVHYVPASALAGEHSLQGLANIILLGKFMAATGFCDDAVMQKTIEKIVPPRKAHLIPKNMEAIRLGASL